MIRRSTYQKPRVQNLPRRMQVVLAAALVALAPAMGWLVLALYLPNGGQR